MRERLASRAADLRSHFAGQREVDVGDHDTGAQSRARERDCGPCAGAAARDQRHATIGSFQHERRDDFGRLAHCDGRPPFSASTSVRTTVSIE